LKLKFQTVTEKTAKNFRGLLYFAAPGILCIIISVGHVHTVNSRLIVLIV